MKTIYSHRTILLSDTTTPVNAYFNLRDRFSAVSLFESSDYQSKAHSKSFIGVNPLITISVEQGMMTTRIKNEPLERQCFSKVEDLEEGFNSIEFKNQDLHAFNGFFGYVSYDAISYFESVPKHQNLKYENLPELMFSVFEYVIIFDNFTNEAQIISNGFNPEKKEVTPIINAMNQRANTAFRFKINGSERVNQSDKTFINAVEKAKLNVKRGDVFQLVLSRCFEQDYQGDDFQVYRRLRASNPSPYMFYFDMGKAKIFGTSPEAQLKITNGVAEIHPIAGTVKRLGSEADNEKQVEKLKKNRKENAEHVMLIDLARNDLNRTCTGVKVEAYKTIQYFSHVIHMVSKVTGDLPKTSTLPTFTASFPAGTLSGAPKHKAMSLIQTYEPHNRGFYGGAIGHISPNGNLNMAIIIRSCLAYQNKLHYQAGAGIVLDSLPQAELEEVDHKIKAVKQAIQLARN